MSYIFTTNTAPLFAHDVYIELEIDRGVSESYSIDLLDIGKLKYEFDIPNSGSDTTKIGARMNSFAVTVDNYIDSSNTVIDVFEDQYSSGFDEWYGFFYFRNKGGSYGDPVKFKFSRNDIEYDFISQKIKINLTDGANYDDTELADDFHFEVRTEYTPYSIGFLNANTGSALTASEYIECYLAKKYFGDITTVERNKVLFQSDMFNTDSINDFHSSSGNDWVITDRDDTGTVSDNITAGFQVGLCASLEGAIYGSGLGEGFYIPRKKVIFTETIDTDEIEILDKEEFLDALYKGIVVSHDDQESVATSESLFAEKNINISFDRNYLFYADIISNTSCDEISNSSNLVDSGKLNYEKAFGFDRGVRVRVKYRDIANIKPYSVIQFDSDAPSLYQGKDFRIKEIEYDWKANKVDMELYEI